MVLYMIGVGLDKETDISLRGLEAVKNCDKIYFESYTSRLSVAAEALEKLYGKPIIKADRELVEKEAENTILKDAKEGNAAFLVVGDVFGATTHIDLRIRAFKDNIPVKVIHGPSVLTAIGITGLEIYKFGKTVSIPFHNEHVISPIKGMNENRERGLHTLMLLDLDLKNDRLMSIKEAAEYLIREGVDPSWPAIGCAALGSEEPEIFFTQLKDIGSAKFTKFPQSLIIPGEMHFMEEEALEMYKLK